MTNIESNKIKEYSLIVNAREKLWLQKEISFEEIVVLGFGLVEGIVMYTVTYRKGDNNKHEGIMVRGDIVKIKDGMIFNVTQTNRS